MSGNAIHDRIDQREEDVSVEVRSFGHGARDDGGCRGSERELEDESGVDGAHGFWIVLFHQPMAYANEGIAALVRSWKMSKGLKLDGGNESYDIPVSTVYINLFSYQ